VLEKVAGKSCFCKKEAPKRPPIVKQNA
jgi:hypothetical protein